MSAKQNQPYPPEGEPPAQMEVWAGQLLRVLEKVAERAASERTAEGRPLSTDALAAVASFKELDKRLETLPAQ